MRDAACSVVEGSLEIIFNEVVPSVDLEVSVHLSALGLEGILVASNQKLLSVVGVVIWTEQDETELGDFSSVLGLELEVVDHPSATHTVSFFKGYFAKTCTYLELFWGMEALKSSQVSVLAPSLSISTEVLSAEHLKMMYL